MIGARSLINKELARFHKLQSQVLDIKERHKAQEVDIRRYAKYLLQEGTTEEKRDLLAQLRGNLVMGNGEISVKH